MIFWEVSASAFIYYNSPKKCLSLTIMPLEIHAKSKFDINDMYLTSL